MAHRFRRNLCVIHAHLILQGWGQELSLDAILRENKPQKANGVWKWQVFAWYFIKPGCHTRPLWGVKDGAINLMQATTSFLSYNFGQVKRMVLWAK